MNKLFRKALLNALLGSAMTVGCVTGAQALAVVTLPTTPFDGLGPQTYDQGLVYSASLLDQVQTAGYLPGNTSNFQFATGTGTLGVIVYTSNNVSNPAPFAQPMDSLNSGDFVGTWGVGQTGTVGALRSLLTIGGVNYQPLFVFDHNENAQSPDLLVTGQFSIYRGASQIASWSLDMIANGSYDQTAYVTSCGDPSIGPGATNAPPCQIQTPTLSGNTYSWTTTGSGKPDYFAVFPTLNLYDGAFLDSDIIVGTFALSGNQSGFEELSIAGYAFGSNVPEPGSLLLTGLGLAGLGLIRRRRVSRAA